MPPLEKKTPPLPDMKKHMSKLERLMEDLCPNGVEYKKLENVCDFITGFSFKSSLFKEYGNAICKTTNIIDGYISFEKMDYFDLDDYKENLEKYIIKKNDIIIGMSGTIKVGINKSNTICYLNQRVGKFIPNINHLNNKFLYYFLCNIVETLYTDINEGSVKNLSNDEIKNICIPVPPLPVQKEIVRILDIFSELISELNLELNKRKSQYKYYINKLLTFSQPIPFEHLKEHIILRDNERKPVTKKDRISGCYPYYGANGIQDYVGNFIFDGTFLLVGEDGSVITENGAPILNWAVGKIWVNNHAHILSEKKGTLLRYLYYALQCVNISSVVRGTPPKLNQQNLNNIKIPVPPLEEQKRIVSILDRFDALCNDLSSGLPAEIEARKKQYEYYRDKLLTFKEAK